MKSDVSMVLVGTLVLGALALGTGALVAFGSLDPLSRSARVLVLLDESVSGLEEGAAVKLRGVKIGQVDALRVLCEPEKARTVVMVACSIDSDEITDYSGVVIDLAEKKTFDRLIDKGLRARVALAGVTGLRFLHLDFYEPDEYPARYPRDLGRLTETDLVIPAIPSTISELTESVAEILSELEEANLSDTATKLAGALGESEKAMESFTRLSGQLAQLLSKLEVAEVREAVEQFSTTLVQAETSLRSVKETSEQVSWVFGDDSGIDRTALRTLEAISEAAHAVERLAEYLERHPDALLTGKRHE